MWTQNVYHIVAKLCLAATLTNCGKLLTASATTLYWKHYRGTRLIAVPNGKNAEDWTIRSLAPKTIFGNGEGSETKCKWVGDYVISCLRYSPSWQETAKKLRTLNTFHLSGVASASTAVRGVPRMKELMSVTKSIKAPSMTIYLKDPHNGDDKKSTEILNSIQTTYFRDIVKGTKVYYDPDDFNTTVDEDRFFVETYRELMNEGLMQKAKLYPWLLRFEFDRTAMVERSITMMDVYNVLTDFYEDLVHVMFSDDNSKNLIFRIKIEDNGEERDIITEIKALERSILENLIIKGVSKISKVVKNPVTISRYDKATMAIEQKKEWVLETAGTNMVDVLGLKEVDPIRSVSNDINEIYELLGVEAARQALYNELNGVISGAGLYVNYRHIALLVDTMTNKGYLLSIDRHGINRADIGPFAKCSFEETTDMLVKAGMFSEVDRINGVSANIMLGQIAPAGTGDTEILIDEWKLQDASVSQVNVQEELLMAYDNFEAANNLDAEADESALDNLSFDFSLPTTDLGNDDANNMSALDVKIV